MSRTLAIIALLSGFNWNRAYAPPIGPAQRAAANHAAMQQIAPLARHYHITITLADAIARAADTHGIPRDIAFRLVKLESAFDSLAVSSTGALGLTQVLPSTGGDICPGGNLVEVDANLNCGFRYLGMMRRRYGDWFVATAAYNLGPAVADTSHGLGNDMAYSRKIAGDF